jgi:predicted secreted protein
MAILAGNNGVFQIKNYAGTLTAVSNIRNISIEIKSDTIETTAMGQDYRTYVRGLSSWSGSADIYFDPSQFPTGSSSGLTTLNPTYGTVGSSAPSGNFKVYLGSTGGTDNNTANNFTGDCIITGFSVKSSMDGLVEASVSFQGTSTITFAA